jgi:hypothetical protein
LRPAVNNRDLRRPSGASPEDDRARSVAHLRKNIQRDEIVLIDVRRHVQSNADVLVVESLDFPGPGVGVEGPLRDRELRTALISAFWLSTVEILGLDTSFASLFSSKALTAMRTLSGDNVAHFTVCVPVTQPRSRAMSSVAVRLISLLKPELGGNDWVNPSLRVLLS